MTVNGTHLSRFMDQEKQRNDGYDQANIESAWATTAQLFALRRRPSLCEPFEQIDPTT
jgi:hypothetical protein